MSERSLPPGHLSDEQLAGYIDGVLSPDARSQVESHIADCVTCRAEFVSASRAAADAPAPARTRRFPWVAIAAAAALTFVVVSRRASTPESSSMRAGSDRSASTITVVTPRSGDAVSTPGIQFVWRPMPTIMEYAITVQDPDGRTRWSARTTDTVAALPDSVRVAAGSVLHWYVDGLTADGRSVGTGLQRLNVR